MGLWGDEPYWRKGDKPHYASLGLSKPLIEGEI